MKRKTLLKILLVIGVAVLANLYLGCQDRLTQTRTLELQNEKTKLEIKSEMQQRDIDKLTRDVEELKQKK